MTEPRVPLPDTALRVAVGQAMAVPGELAANAATAARMVALAGADSARLLVLPELFLPGYHPPTLAADPSRCDVTADETGTVRDPRLDALSTAAAGHGVAVLVGAAVRAADGARYLAALLVAADGAVRDAYHKRHLCGAEETDLFAAGTEATTLALGGWRLGVGICYDGCFPEHARQAAAAGAHAMVYPTAYVVGGEHRRDLYYRARALDNTIFVAYANAVGGPEPWRCNGGSAVYEPEGRALVRAPDEGETVLVADLDPGRLAATRADQTMLADAALGEPADRHLLAADPS